MNITNKNIDGGTPFDWGRTSSDYARFRDIYPQLFYDKIIGRNLCIDGQKVLDLGTGTGVLPRNMYRYGAKWTGTDISSNQIAQAEILSEGMKIDYYTAAAEEISFPDETFDVITACQCFWYFDHEKIMPELFRILKPGGSILVLYMAWLPYELSELQGRWLKWGKRLFAGLLAASALWFCWAFQYSEIIREDTLLMLPEGSTRMAEYINVHLQDETLLTDAYRAYYILLNLDDLSNVVTSSNDAFEEDLADPVRRGVDYILVPESGSYGDMDAVNIAYRDLYYHGADWCVEEASFGEFKLFRVLN